MTYDEMLITWRAQEREPLYDVSPSLLRTLVSQERSGTWRELRLELLSLHVATWAIVSATLAVVLAVLYAVGSLAARGGTLGDFAPTSSDYLTLAIGIVALLACASAPVISDLRQARRERVFGNSLQEDIRRNLSRIDHQLSLRRRWMMFATLAIAWAIFAWIVLRISPGWSGWFQVFNLAWVMLSPLIWLGHSLKKRLLPVKARLSQLLDLLNASE